jgi:hypothetical protein
MKISEAMVRYYLDGITLGYFNDNDLPPDSVEGYYPQVEGMRQRLAAHGDENALRSAFEHILANPQFEAETLAGDRYPYSEEEIREIIAFARHTLWPNSPPVSPHEATEVTLVDMPLEEWWERHGTSGRQ